MSATTPSFRDTDDVLARSRYHAVEPRRTAFHRLVATEDELGPTFARLALGIVLFPHGAQKLFGWFGGYGISGSIGYFNDLGIPNAISTVLVFVEVVASILLVTGTLTRIAAVLALGMMVGAIVLVHAPLGFFMNWYGDKPGEGFEFHILAIGLALVSLFAGAGKASVDRALMERRAAEGGSVGPALTHPGA